MVHFQNFCNEATMTVLPSNSGLNKIIIKTVLLNKLASYLVTNAFQHVILEIQNIFEVSEGASSQWLISILQHT